MPSLVTPQEVQALVQSSLSTNQIQEVIDREETELIRRFGAHTNIDATTLVRLVEDLVGLQTSVFVDRRINTVASITVSLDAFVTNVTPVSDRIDYRVFADEGRIERALLGVPIKWERDVRVTYTPYDDDDVRKSCLIDVVRIALERQAFQSESVAGEYSYRAPDWEQARESIYGRLKPFAMIS